MAFSTLVSVPEPARHLDDPSWVVIDCRFDLGRPQAGCQAYLAGHIPGAFNRPFTDNLDGEGCLHPVGALAREFRVLLGGRDPGHVIHMCGSGVTACHNLLAMDAAGLAGAKLYAGSWSEWIRDSSTPVVRGCAP